MSFFKPSVPASSNKSVQRLHALIWTLIYGGLLCMVLGISVQRIDDPAGWFMMVAGALAAALGAVLIYVRSKLDSAP